MHILKALVLVGASATAFAGSFSYTGAFGSDDQVQLFNVTLDSDGTITARTHSFAGGVNANSDIIPSGGFAPVLSLFEASGLGLLLAWDYGGGPGPDCGPRATDPATGFCWDAYLSVSLPAGSYLLALTQDDNLPFGPTFSDGFQHAGEGNFTGPQYLGVPGSFIIITGDQRTAAWAVDIEADDASAVPEPHCLVMCLSGLLAIASKRRRELIEPLRRVTVDRWTATRRSLRAVQ